MDLPANFSSMKIASESKLHRMPRKSLKLMKSVRVSRFVRDLSEGV